MLRRNKAFLNDSHLEGGSVSWYVATGDQEEEESILCNCYLISGILQITDCHNQIQIDFNCEKESHIPTRVAKLQTLIDELESMKEGLLLAEKEIKSKRKFYY